MEAVLTRAARQDASKAPRDAQAMPFRASWSRPARNGTDRRRARSPYRTGRAPLRPADFANVSTGTARNAPRPHRQMNRIAEGPTSQPTANKVGTTPPVWRLRPRRAPGDPGERRQLPERLPADRPQEPRERAEEPRRDGTHGGGERPLARRGQGAGLNRRTAKGLQKWLPFVAACQRRRR